MFNKELKQQVLELTSRVDQLENDNKSKDEKLNNIENMLAKSLKVITNVVNKYKSLQSEVDILLDLKKRKESDEPWIDLTGGDIDPSRGVQLKLDWNDAFIDQLRSQGYRGISETELVGQYLLQLSNMIGVDEQERTKEEQEAEKLS